MAMGNAPHMNVDPDGGWCTTCFQGVSQLLADPLFQAMASGATILNNVTISAARSTATSVLIGSISRIILRDGSKSWTAITDPYQLRRFDNFSMSTNMVRPSAPLYSFDAGVGPQPAPNNNTPQAIQFRQNIVNAMNSAAEIETQILLSLPAAEYLIGSIISKAIAPLMSVNKVRGFFEGTKYSNKVLGQIKNADFHAFPESVTAFESSGVISAIKGGDGVTRQMLKIPGSYRGKKGFFELIKEADGTINHRLFRPALGL
jgi:hypothetical protein